MWADMDGVKLMKDADNVEPSDDMEEQLSDSSDSQPAARQESVPMSDKTAEVLPEVSSVGCYEKPVGTEKLSAPSSPVQDTKYDLQQDEVHANQGMHGRCSAGDGRHSAASDRSEVKGEQDEEQPEVELDTVAVEKLRQRSFEEPVSPRDIMAVEMGTFQRSSTRRDSFVLAIQNEDELGERSEVTVEDKAGSSDANNGETSGASFRGTNQKQRGKSLGFQEMEILVDEEYSRPRRCGRFGMCVAGVSAVVILGSVVTIILVPLSLVYVEYYQMALARSKLTGRVERNMTIYPGCHLFFPDTELIPFKATAHVVLTDLEVSSSDGLVFRLQLSLQYFIKAEELGQLHRNYGDKYEAVVRRVIDSEVKNAAVQLSLDQFRLNRTTVERHFYQRLAFRLEGNCCPPCCPRHCAASSQYAGHNCSTCSRNATCVSGLHVSLLPQHLQLGVIDLPEDISERLLRTSLLKIETEKEILVQESKVERKVTERLTQAILNEASEVRQEARAEARRLGLEADASADLTRHRAYTEAMAHLFTILNITTMQHQLDLLLTLAFRDLDLKDRLHLHQFNQLSLVDSLLSSDVPVTQHQRN